MVDLVKLRRKAKKAGGNTGANPDHGAVASPDPGHSADPVVQAPATSGGAQAAAGATGGPVADSSEASTPRQSPAAQGIESGPGSSKLERFKEQAGKLRDVAHRDNAPAGDQEGQLELLAFVIGGETYAIDIEHIVEIVPPRTLTRVPNADRFIVGIISLRGTIVALLDVRRRLRQPAAALSPDSRLVVLDQRGQALGFEVDRVLRVVKLTAAEIEPHPVVHASEADDCIRGVFRHDGALTILLDLDKLLEGGDPGGQSALKERVASTA